MLFENPLKCKHKKPQTFGIKYLDIKHQEIYML